MVIFKRTATSLPEIPGSLKHLTQAWHLFFQNAYFSGVHKHADNLSFTLFALGRDWLVDSGMSPYRNDCFRAHCLGPYAHNGIIVDQAAFPLPASTPPPHSLRIRSELPFQAIAEHAFYPNLKVRREIEMLGELGWTVTDSVVPEQKSDQMHTVERLFQLAPDLVWKKSGDLFIGQKLPETYPQIQFRLCQAPKNTSLEVVERTNGIHSRAGRMTEKKWRRKVRYLSLKVLHSLCCAVRFVSNFAEVLQISAQNAHKLSFPTFLKLVLTI